MLMEHAEWMPYYMEYDLKRTAAQVGITRSQQRVPGGAEQAKHQQLHYHPGGCKRHQSQARTPPVLKEHRPKAKTGNNHRQLFFTGHRKNGKDEEPDGTPGINEIQRKKQESSCQGNSMKFKDARLLLCRVE